MNDNTISDLTAALRLSPDNIGLRLVIVQMLLERDDIAAACELATHLEPSAELTPADRRTVAEALRRGGKAGDALAFLAVDTDPETLVLRARVLAALMRIDE